MASYPLHPPLECDVIMKGGITSGVIYLDHSQGVLADSTGRHW
jgi:hypothetical protein